MRFQVLRHALAPAFVWVLVAFACGTTIGQLALQRVQVIEAEHPVLIDQEGTVVGQFISFEAIDSADGDSTASYWLPYFLTPNVVIRVDGGQLTPLHARRDGLWGTARQIAFTQSGCNGEPMFPITSNVEPSYSPPITPMSFKVASSDRFFVMDISAAPMFFDSRSDWDSWSGACQDSVQVTKRGVPAHEHLLGSFRPPFSVVMRSDLQPGP